MSIRTRYHRSLIACLALLTATLADAAGPAHRAGFDVSAINVPAGATWAINRPIDVRFTAPVDFASVNLNTLQIYDHGTLIPAFGDYSLIADDTVRFSPRCPRSPDLADGGLLPGRPYRIAIPAAVTAQPTVLSTAGVGVGTAVTLDFTTPPAASALLDTVAGPPAAVVRASPNLRVASRLELANDPAQRIYFEPRAVPDPVLGADVPAGFRAPLNLYSVPRTSVAIVLAIDQMIGLDPANLAPDRVRLEYEESASVWKRFPREVALPVNCTVPGTVLRVEPRGVLPQNRRMRVVLGMGFRDVGSEALAADVVVGSFLVGTAVDPGTTTAGDAADELFQGFESVKLEDKAYAPPLGETRAVWSSDGKLVHGGFEGTGGPGGTFDWVVDGTVILDTSFSLITNETQTAVQTVVNGLVDVRSLWVKATGILIIEGPNPCSIRASGSVPVAAGAPGVGVYVQGEIRANGRSNRGVVSFSTANIPEPGAPGTAGGGRGGTGSYLTTQSTPQGGHGFGPFDAPNGGGRGGESGFNPQVNDTLRRPGGGGGGRLGLDQMELARPICPDQRVIGMDAEKGFDGAVTATGALHPGRPAGGDAGPSPFRDGDAANDFWGTLITSGGGAMTGELLAPLPGEGGGAGGDACLTGSFPTSPFLPTGDEKGSGGGGAGGVLHIQALGTIQVGGAGSATRARLLVNGGTGGGGENTSGINRIGGGSGGGSGGHLILQSASRIDLSRCTSVSTSVSGITYWGGCFARGGQGGEGQDGLGGARANGVETRPELDALPANSYPNTSAPCGIVAGLNDAASTTNGYPNPPQFVVSNTLGTRVSAGGDGGPGIIQLHVPTLADILIPATVVPSIATNFRNICFPLPVGATPSSANTPAQWGQLLPSFARRSSARSRWIALGAPHVNPTSAAPDAVTHYFGGTNPLDGHVLTSGAVAPFDIAELAPVASGNLASAPGLPSIGADGRSVLMDGAGIDDLYRRNPALAKGYLLRVGGVEHEVAAALYQPATGVLRLIVATSGTPLAGLPAGTPFALVPRFFRAGTENAFDEVGDARAVRLRFQAAAADANGEPDEAAASLLVSDLAALNQPGATWRFVRFLVEFDEAPGGGPVSVGAPGPFLDFLRLPFRF